MNRVSLTLVIFLIGILALSASCARKPNDAKISSDIQNRMSQDSGLSTKQLTVQTSNGVVTLAGFVDNNAQREAAARQAASVEGVKEVVNNLQVGIASNAALPPPAARIAQITPSMAQTAKIKKARRSNISESDAMDNAAAPTDSANNSEPPPPQDQPPADAQPPAPPAPPQPQKVTIEQGAQVSIRLIDTIDSEKDQMGTLFTPH